MVKVSGLKNLPEVLKIHGENNQQDFSTGVQVDSCGHTAPEKLASPAGVQHDASPAYPGNQINNSFTLTPGIIIISLGRHRTSVRQRPNPLCAAASAFLRKQVTFWSWNMLLLNLTISLEGRNNIKPVSWLCRGCNVLLQWPPVEPGSALVPCAGAETLLIELLGSCSAICWCCSYFVAQGEKGWFLSFSLFIKPSPFIASEPQTALCVHIWEARTSARIQPFKYPTLFFV